MCQENHWKLKNGQVREEGAVPQQEPSTATQRPHLLDHQVVLELDPLKKDLSESYFDDFDDFGGDDSDPFATAPSPGPSSQRKSRSSANRKTGRKGAVPPPEEQKEGSEEEHSDSDGSFACRRAFRIGS